MMSHARDLFFLFPFNNTFTVALIIRCVPQNSVSAKCPHPPCIYQKSRPDHRWQTREREEPKANREKTNRCLSALRNMIPHLDSFKEPLLSRKGRQKRDSVSLLKDKVKNQKKKEESVRERKRCTLHVCVYMSN